MKSMSLKKCLSIALIMTLALVLPGAWAEAAPFLVCDPQAGVQTYKIEVPIQHDLTGHFERVLPAEADGSLKWDLQEWPYKDGRTYDCKASAGGNWVVRDIGSGSETTVYEFGPSSDFQLTSPAVYAPANWTAEEQ